MPTSIQVKKITLDHNCLIHINQNTDIGVHIRSLLNCSDFEFYIANVGASEMCANLQYANNYEAFENLLSSIGLAKLPRLNPMFILDFSYWDNCIFVDEPMVKLSEDISQILFNKILIYNSDKAYEKKWRNRLCDIQTMWCHIYYGNEVFLTTDKNFMKSSKLNRLINIGAKILPILIIFYT